MPTCDVDFVVDLPAPRVWLALKDGNTIFPTILPQIFSNIETIDGANGEPGSVRLIKFGSAVPDGAYVKEKLVSIDHPTMTVVSEEIEGGHLAFGISKWICTMKLIPEGDKTKMSLAFDVEGEGPAVELAIEQVKQGTAPTFQGLAKYVQESGIYV